jgi:hypothetical protein
MKLTFPEHTREILPQLWRSASLTNEKVNQDTFPSSVAGSLSPRFRAAILYHRKAFGMEKGDPATIYMNIYSRHMKSLFPVLHIMAVLHEATLILRDPGEDELATAVQRLRRTRR